MNDNRKSIAHRVADMFDRTGVFPLPRNYYLFYTCLANSDPELREAVRKLGNSPVQSQIDRVIERFLPDAPGMDNIGKQQDRAIGNIGDVLALVTNDRNETGNFSAAMQKLSANLARAAAAGKLTPEMLPDIVKSIIESSNRKVEAGNRTVAGVEKKKDELEKVREELKRMTIIANTDQLTGLLNRRAFDELMAEKFGNGEHSGMSLILMDIDHFKKVNDTYGHAAGDLVLKKVAKTIKDAVRQDTPAFRTGGEEFGVVVATSTRSGVLNIAERIREEVEAIASGNPNKPLKITVSLGAVSAVECESPEVLYQKADAALYNSKRDGRNKTTMFEDMGKESGNRYSLYSTPDAALNR